MSFRVTVLTLFPEAFPGTLGLSILGTALQRQIWSLEPLDIRRFAYDKHASVDDTPAGGGPGMVLRADVLGQAIDHAAEGDTPEAPRPRLLMSARGQPWRQDRARQIAGGPGLIVVCGRFEGVDQRVVEARDLEEVSVGDAVTAGGEAPAMVVLESILRLLPGVVGAQASTIEESFEDGLLEAPHYTRPRVWEDRVIPDVLTSGHHGRVAAWRREQGEAVTRERRPDLWQRYLETGRTDGKGRT